MAKIVVARNQQAEMRRLHPKPAYSRVVSCGIIDDGIAAPDFAFVPVLGQTVWLLGVMVSWNDLGTVIDQITNFKILTGTTAPATALEILTWDNVLPKWTVGGVDDVWRLYDGEGSRTWTMMKLYTGMSRMFGIWADRRQDFGLNIDVSFEISEG